MEMHRLRLPLPLRLDHLNAYLVGGPTGHALVDTGMATPAGREALTARLGEHGLEPAQLREVFVTHYHGDHWGLASWLQGLGVRVVMPQVDSSLLLQWLDHPAYDAEAVTEYRSHGVPAAALDRATRALSRMRALSPRFVADRTVEDREEIELAGEPFEVLLTPGHTPGHACLHHRTSRALLVGDHVLPHITPNISRELGSLVDPLTAYRRSLQAVQGRGFTVAWPAHGEPMRGADLDRRIDEILAHHRDREESLLALIADEPCSGYRLCEGLFGLSALDGWETWMALGETMAHLTSLQTAGRVRSDESQGQVLWRRT
jgi:glyoxylase-like metal-dependent hydrolase (beta-lactamase superfamily II)